MSGTFSWVKRVLVPLITATLLAACGGNGSDVASPADASAPAPTAAPAPAPTGVAQTTGTPANVPEALKFSAPLVGGGEIELTTLAGRPVLLWFWAPW